MGSKSKSQRWSLGLLLIGSVATTSSLSEAVGSQQGSGGRIPGSMCQKVGSLGTLQVQITGAVENASSTSALGIDCPIPNPAQGNFAGGTGALNFQKLVYVDHSPGAIRCSLIYEDAGSTAFHLKTQLSVGNDDTVREMQIDAVGAFADGHLHVRCTVPPAD